MSYNQLSYDECSYKTAPKKLTEPLEYMMYQGKYNNDSKCRFEYIHPFGLSVSSGSTCGQALQEYAEFELLGGNDVSIYSGNLVDLESYLRGQTRVLSDCPDQMFKLSDNKELSQNLVNQHSYKLDYYNNTKTFIHSSNEIIE